MLRSQDDVTLQGHSYKRRLQWYRIREGFGVCCRKCIVGVGDHFRLFTSLKVCNNQRYCYKIEYNPLERFIILNDIINYHENSYIYSKKTFFQSLVRFTLH